MTPFKLMVIAYAGIASSLANAQVPTTTVFGLTIGQPLGLKPCKSDTDFPKKTLCVKDRRATTPSYTGQTELLFDFNALPIWVGTTRTQLIDGKLEMVLITTSADAQALIYRDLVRKFGDPVSRNFDGTEGGLGPRRLEAGWVNGPVRIDFVGATAGGEYGYVQIGTPRGIDAWRDAAAKRTPVRRTL